MCICTKKVSADRLISTLQYIILMNKDSLLNKFRAQIEIELKNAKDLERSVKSLKNVLVRELLRSIH